MVQNGVKMNYEKTEVSLVSQVHHLSLLQVEGVHIDNSVVRPSSSVHTA